MSASSLALVAAIVVIGCAETTGDTGDEASKTANDRPIVVTRSEGQFEPWCEPRSIGTRLQNFSRALRTVNARALRRFWTGDFRGFGVSRREKLIFRAFSYRGGVRKLRSRGGLRLRFDEVEVVPPGESITFQGIFRKRDGKKRPLFGKGGLHCGGPGHIQMSVNFGPWAEHPANVTRCPEATKPVPKRAMIVCSRKRR